MDLRDPRAGKTILGALLAGAVLYVHFATTLLPVTYRSRSAAASELRTRYESLSLENRRARAASAQLPRLESEARKLAGYWEDVQALLPPETAMESLLREIAARGRSSGVDFLLFRPLSPVPSEFHTEHPIEIRVDGGYHQVARLLREIATMQRIVAVRDLELEEILASEENPHSTRAHFTAVAYTLGTGAPGVAPPAQAPAGAAPPAAGPGGQTPPARPSMGRSEE